MLGLGWDVMEGPTAACSAASGLNPARPQLPEAP